MSYFFCLWCLMPFITRLLCFIRWHKTTSFISYVFYVLFHMSFMSYAWWLWCLISFITCLLCVIRWHKTLSFICLLCLISHVLYVSCLLSHALCVSLDDIRQRISFHMSFMSYFLCLISYVLFLMSLMSYFSCLWCLMPFITCPTCFIRWHKTTYRDVVHSEIRTTSRDLVLRHTNNVTRRCPQTTSHDVVQFSLWFVFRAMCCRVLHHTDISFHFLVLQSVAYFVLFPVTS